MRFFKRFEKPQGSGLVHFTLSMPESMRLSDRDWHEVGTYMLHLSGLPPDLVPWIMVGREPTRCDHVHLLSALQTWSGRELELATSPRFTDSLDRTIRHHLGIPELDWYPPPEMSLVSPVRSGKRQRLATSFANDINHAIDLYLPATVDELNSALGRVGSNWTVSASVNQDGLLTPYEDVLKASINPADAGSHFSSKAIIARLAFARRVATARAAQFITRLSRIIHPDQIPALKNGTEHDDDFGHRSIENQDRLPARRHQEIAPAFGPAGATGPRPDQRLRGKTDGADDRDQRGLRRAGSPVQSDASVLRGRQPEIGFPVGDRRRGRGHWLIRLRLLARRLGMRIKTCFEAGGQVIKVTDDELMVMRLDLRTMVIDVDKAPTGSNINKIKAGLVSRYSASLSESEVSVHDNPEPF